MTPDLRAFTFTLAMLLGAPSAALADGWDLGGSVGVEARIFPEDAAWPGQSADPQLSTIIEGDARWRSEDRRWQIYLNPWARIDSIDEDRTHADLREGYVRYSGDWVTVEAGLIKVFWGVTESRHLIDIINQTDLVEYPDAEDKLGQPAIRVLSQQDWGLLEFFVLPTFRERTFPGSEGRFRTPLPIDTGRATFDSEDEEQHVDLAARWSHYIGDWDIGIGAFHGTAREPSLMPIGGTFAPHYRVISQLSADVQLTSGPWLWKFEGMARWGEADPFAATVGGVEYTFYGVTDGGADFGVLAEVLWDGRSSDPAVSAPTIFDNDVFIGGRFALNDSADTSFLGGVVIDYETGSTLFRAEYERRIWSNYVLEIEAIAFDSRDALDPLMAFERDDALTARLTRYF